MKQDFFILAKHPHPLTSVVSVDTRTHLCCIRGYKNSPLLYPWIQELTSVVSVDTRTHLCCIRGYKNSPLLYPWIQELTSVVSVDTRTHLCCIRGCDDSGSEKVLRRGGGATPDTILCASVPVERASSIVFIWDSTRAGCVGDISPSGTVIW